MTFHRTLRVPDDNKNSALPPSLGVFPLEPAHKYEENLSESMKARGGILMPITRREAMWISFHDSEECAVKISVGGVNSITGHSRDKAPPSATTQDYLALPVQPWLDGICTEPGVVRQFVAMPLGQGYTVEEQMTGQAKIGGIQIDVFPSFKLAVSFHSRLPSKLAKAEYDMSLSPGQLSIAVGEFIEMNIKSMACITLEDYANRISAGPVIQVRCGLAPIRVHVTQLGGQSHSVAVSSTTTVGELSNLIGYKAGQCTVSYNRQVLSDNRPKPSRFSLSRNPFSPSSIGRSQQVTLGDYNVPTGATLLLNFPIPQRDAGVEDYCEDSLETMVVPGGPPPGGPLFPMPCSFALSGPPSMPAPAPAQSFGASVQSAQMFSVPPHPPPSGSVRSRSPAMPSFRASSPKSRKATGQSMGMAAGGKIEQLVYPDSNPATLYDDEKAERLWLHTISSADWEIITGVVPPLTPIVPGTYKSYNYPWFKLYDEHKGPALLSSGAFDNVQSVKTLDNSDQSELTPSGVDLFDPNAPPPCTSHRTSISSCVFRPCSHTACDACIDKATASAKCPNCDEMVEAFVGFKKPIKVNIGAGSACNWKYVEDQIQGGDQNVISLFLDEDQVVRLHGKGC